jgi:hypothetical protein
MLPRKAGEIRTACSGRRREWAAHVRLLGNPNIPKAPHLRIGVRGRGGAGAAAGEGGAGIRRRPRKHREASCSDATRQARDANLSPGAQPKGRGERSRCSVGRETEGGQTLDAHTHKKLNTPEA